MTWRTSERRGAPTRRRLLAFVFVLTVAPDVLADVVHQVRPGETLAAIAEHYYGDATREAMLVAANVLQAQGNLSILPGMRIMVPSVGYYRVVANDTWDRIAQRELGSGSRAMYLAQVNHANALVLPSPGSVLRIPYMLRYVVLDDEPLFEIARRFYSDRAQVQFILEFNHLSSTRLQRGQVLLLPLPDIVLREEPVCENTAPLAEANTQQARVEHDLPSLGALVSRGQYVEALTLGARLAGTSSLSSTQRVTIDRAMAEAYCALDRVDLAADAFRDAIATDPSFTLDGAAPPKMLEAFGLARGYGALRSVDPAPPTARPLGAH